jgi:uncharacterized transporter YbjL
MVLKIIGLALFFSGTGFNTRTQIVKFDIRMSFYGIIIPITAIICGLLSCKIISRRYLVDCSFIIAGEMTSNPKFGAISSKSDAFL